MKEQYNEEEVIMLLETIFELVRRCGSVDEACVKLCHIIDG